jgi:hypothetical protein
MDRIRYIRFFLVIICFCLTVLPSLGQLGIKFDIKKPKQYETRVLKSEKADQKKFNAPRRFIQNTATHYNYVFNATNKLNEVLERAKSAHRDDYAELLSFYNYSLDVTAQDKTQLDSIIYKSSTGIVLHDLRNDWIDNLFLLWGAAYYLRKDFDSAYLNFQFINYAFAEKEKDGYYKNIGSRMDGNSALSIATKEKNTLPKRLFTEPPARNDAFIWQIRTLMAQEEFGVAAGLIETLKKDTRFPDRLRNDLEEVQAYWFYKQNIFDSAASHLTNALSNAGSKQERARWEFLAGQLFEMSGDNKNAVDYYADCIKHTTNPVMEIYARLNTIKNNKEGGEGYIDKNIAELLKMARRDKYADYRDVIYYTAAQMELERNNIGAAQLLLLKATKNNIENTAQRNKAFLKLADLAFNAKDYRNAYNFLDSLKLNDPSAKDLQAINTRKDILKKIITESNVVSRQDSLQALAKLPEEERKPIIKKIVKQLRKEQGLKDEGSSQNVSGGSGAVKAATEAADLFNQPAKGEWYFYNAAAKIKGAQDFKSYWGNRPNIDNWRRISAVRNTNINTRNPGVTDDVSAGNPAEEKGPVEITYDALSAKLPLTDSLLKISNDSIQNALFNLGKIYSDEIEDCTTSIETLELLRTRYPEFTKMDDVLFKLFYCYSKTGNTAKAAEVKQLMTDKYKNSPLTAIVTTGKNPSAKTENKEATKIYENIYDLFIEGKFEEALANKKIADSIYGKHFWTQQLLYIESVYYIKQRNDSAAGRVLQTIVTDFANTPIAAKATNLINVLKRRTEIETELRNMSIQRPAEDSIKATSDTVAVNPVVKVLPVNKPPVQTVTPPVTKKDTVAVKIIAPAVYSHNPNEAHAVMIILNKVDPVFRNESKNSFFMYNRQKYYNQTFDITAYDIDQDNRLLIITGFANAQAAIDYITAAKPKATTEIIPWLKQDRYAFSIIAPSNLEKLKADKNIISYKKFIEGFYPGKF